MLAGQKVLVTGAAGFIGSHLVEALIHSDAIVTAMVRYNSGSTIGCLGFLPQSLRARLVIKAGNIEDADFVMSVVRDQDIVMHLAALIAIPYSYVAPRSYVRTNIEGTLNIVEAARRLGTRRVVHTSTSEVYGTALRIPIDEGHPLQGQSPYSASKIGADKIAEAYFRSFGTPIVTLRPFNTYGPRQSARAFIPTIISQALAMQEVRLGSVMPQRDMTYVSDTVEGFIKAGSVYGIEGETINLGSGEAFSIAEFAQRILRIMSVDKPVVHDANRDRPENSEVKKLVSDNNKAAELLNWAPSVALDDGLRKSIDFISDNLHLYDPRIFAF